MPSQKRKRDPDILSVRFRLHIDRHTYPQLWETLQGANETRCSLVFADMLSELKTIKLLIREGVIGGQVQAPVGQPAVPDLTEAKSSADSSGLRSAPPGQSLKRIQLFPEVDDASDRVSAEST